MTIDTTASLQFNSLVDHYLSQKVEGLSAIKSLAIKQAVSFSYEWFIHKFMRQETTESFNFATFACLIQAEPKYYGNYIEAMIEDHNISESVIETCLQHIRSGFIPYQIWIDKLIADLKGSDYYSTASARSMLLVYLCKSMRISLIGYMKMHKALIDAGLDEKIMDVVYTAHALYLDLPKEYKDNYMLDFKHEDEGVRRSFVDNELQLFRETLIDMTSCPINLQKIEDIESGKLSANTDFWDEPAFPAQPLINRSRAPMSVELSDDEKAELDKPVDEIEENEAPVKTAEYVVEKVALRGSNRVLSTNKFTTEVEAENFIEDVVNAVPDIVNSFKFTINGMDYIPKRNR